MQLRELFFFITIYSFFGWCVEVIYHTVKYGEFSNRGFVGGPVCTIYGVGFAGVAYLLEPFRGSVFVLFPASVVLATLLEFITGWVLEKLFHEKWWDYTDEPFNVKGYICLRFSLLWGLACTGTLMIIHPLVEKAYAAIPAKVCIVLLSVVAVVYLIDWSVTVIEIRKIRIRLGIAKSIADWMDDVSVFLGSGLHEGTLEVMEKGEEGKEFIAEQREAWTEKKSELQLSMAENREIFLGRLSYERDRLKKAYEENRAELSKRAGKRWETLLRRVDRIRSRYATLFGKTSHTERRLTHAFPALHITENEPETKQEKKPEGK